MRSLLDLLHLKPGAAVRRPCREEKTRLKWTRRRRRLDCFVGVQRLQAERSCKMDRPATDATRRVYVSRKRNASKSTPTHLKRRGKGQERALRRPSRVRRKGEHFLGVGKGFHSFFSTHSAVKKPVRVMMREIDPAAIIHSLCTTRKKHNRKKETFCN